MPQIRFRLGSQRIAVAGALVGLLVLFGNGLTASHLTGATLLVGNNSIQPAGDSDAAGSAEALQYTASAGGTVNSLSLCVDTGNSAGLIDVALYSDSNNNPGVLLTSGALKHAVVGAWNQTAVPAVSVASGTKYWLVLLGVDGQVNFRDLSSGGGPTQSSAQATLTALPASWSIGRTWANSPASFYASDNAGATPTPTPQQGTQLNNAACTVTINGVQETGICNGMFTAGDLTPTPASTSTPTSTPTPSATATTSATPTSTPPTSTPTSNATGSCFKSPGSCGYPDPAYGNVGAGNCASLPKLDPSNPPAGTYYSGSGNGLEITADNTTISNMNLGNFNIYISSVNNFKLDHVCMNVDGGDDEGSMGIIIPAGVTGTVVENSTISGMNSTSQSLGAAVDNNGSGTLIENDYFYNVGGAGPGAGGGSATIENTYQLVNATVPLEHYEPIYCSDNTLTIDHNTILNVQDQTADIFCNTGGGGGGACDNHLTITNNLMAGGGYMLYPCGNASSMGSSTMSVINNRFSRGYYPNGGSYGIAAYIYCNSPPAKGQSETWAGNVWDDATNTSIGCP